MKKSATLDLINGSIGKTLLAFAFPFMLSSLMQTLYNTVDTIIVGQFVGTAGLSAVSVGGSLTHLSFGLCNGLAVAGQVMIAQSIGGRRYDAVKRIILNLMLTLTVFSIAVSIVFIVFNRQLLGLLSTPPEALKMASEYVIICSAGFIFTGLYNLMSAIFRAMGDSRHPFIFICIASAVNVVLDLLFVCVFHMGAAGAALATIIGQAVSVVYSLSFLLHHRQEFHLDFVRSDLRADKTTILTICRLGIPMMIQSSAVNVSFLFVAKFVNQLGVSVSAAFGVGQKLLNIPMVLAQGVTQSATAMYAQNLGARRFERVRSTVRWAILYNAVVYGCFCGFCLFFPQTSFRIFTQQSDVLAYAGSWTGAMMLGGLAHSIMCSTGLMQAVGDTKLSLIIGLFDAFCGRVLLSALLGIVCGFGAAGFFYGYNLATFFTAIPAFIYYKFVHWENRGLNKLSSE